MKLDKKRYTTIILAGIFFVYLLMSSSAINEKQMVYGDMATQYISKRLAEGAKLYSQVPVLYGPIMYLVGAGLVNQGLTYAGMKIFMLGIAVISGILVFLITRKSFGNTSIGLLSTTIYMFLPIHYGVAPIFHADSFAILFILTSLYFLLFQRRATLLVAGVFALVAFFTKIPAIPIVLAPLAYFLFYKKKEGIFYAIPLLVMMALGMMYIQSLGSSDNSKILLDYLFKDPNPPFSILQNFVWIEGIAFFVAMAGLAFYIKTMKLKSPLIFVALASPLGFAAILLRGVGIYEANYMEPFIAIFSAYAIFHLKDKWNFNKLKVKILVSILFALIFLQVIIFDYPGRERVADWGGNKRAMELNTIADSHTILLEKYTKKGDLVVASPMAVSRTDRISPLDDSYPELLKLKYSLGYQNAQKEVATLTKMIEDKKIKMLITYNSTTNNGIKYNTIQNDRFFPFNTVSLSNLLSEKYDKFEEDGFYYYVPKP